MLYFSTRRPRHTAFDRRAGGFIRFAQSPSRRSFVQRRPIADRDLRTSPSSFQGSGAGEDFGNQRCEVGPGWRFEVANQDVERRIGLGLVGTARPLVEQHPASDEIGISILARMATPMLDKRAMKSHMQHYPKHYCGVFGVYGHPNAAELTYYGLYALQHRGQESAGIVSCDGKQFRVHKGMGLVPQVFTGEILHNLVGSMAVGHTRYSTTGSSHVRNAQPLTVDCARGQIAIAHNGNLINAVQLREELESRGSIFQTTVDSEIILHLMAQPSLNGHENNLLGTIRRIEGAFSLVIMTEQELIGVRDPHGFRPLCLGRVGDGWVLSSETCALDLIHAKFVRDIEPGEIVVINQDGVSSIQAFPEQERRAFCIFEYVYFARPDSTIAHRNVYKVRVEMGRQLARENPVEADIVVPVPDSGNYAALGFSLESGIPYEMAFIRNHYVGRSFLQPTQLIRDFNVRVK